MVVAGADAMVVEPTAGGRLRVAVVTETFPPEVNGVALTVARLVDALLRRGHSVELVRPRQGAGDESRQEAMLRVVTVAGSPLPGYPGLRFGLPAGRALARRWQAWRPEVAYVATEGPLGWSAVGACRSLEVPVLSGYHARFEQYADYYRLGLLGGVVKRYLRHLHNRTAATLTPTVSLARELANCRYHNPQVLPRGVDTRHFAPSRRSGGLRWEWGLGDSSLAVLYVGRLAPEKNLDLLVRGFRAVQALRPNARMVLVGDGPVRRSLARRHPDLIFAGQHTGDLLAAHFASADICLLPSLSETFGNVTLEAMASGLAIVAFDYAAPPGRTCVTARAPCWWCRVIQRHSSRERRP